MFSLVNILVPLIHVVIFLIGLIICGSRLNNNRIYKYGLWFFILRIIATIIDSLKNLVFMPIIMRNLASRGNVSLIFALSNIPTLLIGIIAYIILIIGFYQAYQSRDMGLPQTGISNEDDKRV